MENETTSSGSSSGGLRALEIILGLVALAVGILALFFPTAVIVTLVVFFGIALLIVGFLRLATSFSSAYSAAAREANAVIGIIAILIGILILIAPYFATISIVILLGIALLIYGIGQVVVGGTASNLTGGMRALLAVFGILVAIFGLIVIFYPTIGVYTYAFFVSIGFILIGIESLALGITGVRAV